MKKRKKVFAIVLMAVTIAVMLPIGSVQALTEDETLQSEALESETLESETLETELPETLLSETEEIAEEDTESELLTETDVEETETQSETKTEPPEPESEEAVDWNTEENKQILNEPETSELIAKAAQGVSVKIKDTHHELIYESDHFVKEIIHIITLTRNEKIISLIEPYSTNADIYENISYCIYQKTDDAEICLKEGSLEIPTKSKKSGTTRIEATYTQAGDYCIKVKGKWGGEIEIEFACYDFSIAKEQQRVSLKKDTLNLSYGETVHMVDFINMDLQYVYQKEYEIREESGDKNRILEIENKNGQFYIKAIGLNNANRGITTVKIRTKENALMEASDERTLKVFVNPARLMLTAQMDTSEAYMYEKLAVKVQLEQNGKDVTEKLLEPEKHMLFKMEFVNGTDAYEINTRELAYEKGSPYTFYIPIQKEYFKEFTKGAQYTIRINIKGDEEIAYLPYQSNNVIKNVTLLGRRAKIKLSAEQDGIYDYHTYYRGTSPLIFMALEDTTVSQNLKEISADISIEGSGQKALAAEADKIEYQISVADSGVVSVDDSRKYMLRHDRIPLSINGVGTTTLTITADGSSVYTVESSIITITVQDSPLYDDDFMISVMETDGIEEQVFASNAKLSGFETWKAYLRKHNGWINGSVKISLTETGCKYYNLLSLTENEQHMGASKQFCIDSDRKKSEYEFGAENNNTNANTRNYKKDGNGVRVFEMGIDTTAPTITKFVPPNNQYAPTSTENVQYFPQDFVLSGTFLDETSGVAAIEYTTDINAAEGAKWTLFESESTSGDFILVLQDGIYPAIAVRAVDGAGNISEPVCLKNESGTLIKIIVDSTPPGIDVSTTIRTDLDTWQEYSAEGENWTNREIRFQVSEKGTLSDMAGEIVIDPISGTFSGLQRVEFAYQSISEVLRGEPISEDEWQKLVINEQGMAELLIGSEVETPVNKNGCYYFRGISNTGVKSESNVEKRIFLWQKMADKKPIVESGVDFDKCYNEWYNKESGTPIIDFTYPEYDTSVSFGEYAAPITIHYNLNVKDEKGIITSLAEDKTASIHVDFSQSTTPTEFPIHYDDISQLQVKLSDDGIYTLEYWITDAAGNESETETYKYQIDCHEPTGLKIVLDGVEQVIGNESTLVYENFYQNSVSGEASAEYGISGEKSITILKAKRIGEWKGIAVTEDAEQFQIEPGIRCILYIRAVDGAGNMTEGWTRGIIVDNEVPTGEGTPRLIVGTDGANEHGFFNKDVNVKISVKDAPEDGNSAGLKFVTGSIGTDNGNTIANKEFFSSKEEQVSESLMGETEHFSIVETIDAKTNESNDAYITIQATDRSGNIGTDTQELKIDVTKPEIKITFDNENAVNGRYYNTDRRAIITVKELNFDAALTKIKVTKDGEAFIPSISEWHHDKDIHSAYIDFSADGDYMLAVECTDLADNEADKESAEPFTIDKTMPRVEIALESGGMHGGYFNEIQTAVIKVTEHNFNEDDFHIQMQAMGKVGLWEHKNDMHVIKIELLSEGEYAISCSYKDLAGNEILDEDRAKMPLEFIIDMTYPVIEISGVEDNSANAGVVIPNIVVRDIYIEPTNVTIILTTGKGNVMDISSDIVMALTDGGFLYTLNGLDAKPDDIYYLAVNAADKAGNMSELTYRFSLNRRGSAYDLTDLTKFRDNYYNSYKNFEDIKIVEMNVDKVEDFALYLSHNANIIYGKSGSRVLALDGNKLHEAVLYNVDVSGNENIGYVYTYTIYRENFAREGTYRLGIYSKDAAGNEVNNLLEQNGEEIQFVIDNTIPRIVIDGVESNEIYNVSSQEVRVVVDDNFKLAEAELTLVNQDGDVLESWNYFELVKNEGDTARITIGEYNEEISLLYRAVDAAGNEVRTLQGEKEAKSGFLVTTDKFVQLVNKPTQSTVPIPFLAGIGVVIVFFACAIVKKSVLKKRK